MTPVSIAVGNGRLRKRFHAESGRNGRDIQAADGFLPRMSRPKSFYGFESRVRVLSFLVLSREVSHRWAFDFWSLAKTVSRTRQEFHL